MTQLPDAFTGASTARTQLLAEAAAARMQPGFHPALRRYANAMLRTYRAVPLLNKLISEEGRFLIASLALQLHLWRRPEAPADGLTLSRLRALCAEHRVASRGRVDAFLALMRLSGFLAPATSPATAAGDRRLRLLVPTPRMMAHVQVFTAIHLKALDTLWPGRDYARRLEENPAFSDGFHRAAGRVYLKGLRLPEVVPGIKVFTGADAGYMILLHLFLLLPAPEGEPLPGAVDFPYGAAARRFGVSRSHVANLFRAAAAAGLLTPEGSGGHQIQVSERLIALLEEWFAVQMVVMRQAAEAAEREQEVGRGPSPITFR